ncbi:MAG: hypothetical protein E6G41_12360, partial [Actinobacteria bacterium]
MADELLPSESRWPPIIAVVLFMALNVALRIWLPREGASRVPLVVIIEAIFLVALITGNPTGVTERRRLRRFALVLVGLLVAGALWETTLLV